MSDTSEHPAVKIAREMNRLEADNRRLAAELADAEARAARWKRYAAFVEVSTCTDEWGDIDPRHIAAIREEAVATEVLRPGDFDDQEAQS